MVTRAELLSSLQAIRRELANGVANAEDLAGRQKPEHRYPYETGALRQVATGIGSSLDHLIKTISPTTKRTRK